MTGVSYPGLLKMPGFLIFKIRRIFNGIDYDSHRVGGGFCYCHCSNDHSLAKNSRDRSPDCDGEPFSVGMIFCMQGFIIGSLGAFLDANGSDFHPIQGFADEFYCNSDCGRGRSGRCDTVL